MTISAAGFPALVMLPQKAALAAPGGGRRAAAPRPSPAAAEQRRLRLRHVATGATFSGPYHDGRRPDPAAMAELSLVLADHRSGQMRPFDPAALDILWELGRRERMAAFEILSAYRTTATNIAVGGAGDSQHMQARALDVHVPADRLAAFGDAALALARGGVGIYPADGFVHLDSGPVRHWGGAGQAGGTGAQRRPPPQDRVGRIAEAWAMMRRP
jgi:uncharacterized protein YcbK (DUF882 family)